MGRMSHIRRNMSEENKDYRPEQLLVAKILRRLLSSQFDVKTELYVVLRPFDQLDVKGCILDVAVINGKQKIGIRMMGQIHDKPKKIIYDKDQKYVLERNGWEVYDFTHDEMPELWNQVKYGEDDACNAIIKKLKF